MSFEILPSGTDRRTFLKGLGAAGAMTIVGASTVAPMTAYAAQGGDNDTIVVNVFLRGGADGIDIVVPHGDDEYYNRRPYLALHSDGYDDLDGFFGLNSVFAPLLPHFNDGRLAFVHQAGNSFENNRSHFVDQPLMEFAYGPGGWLQRSLQSGGFPQASAGLTIGSAVSGSLVGPWSGSTLVSLDSALAAAASLQASRPLLESMYVSAAPLERDTVALAMSSLDDLMTSGATLGSGYPNSAVAASLRQAAALIKTDIGVRGVAVNSGDWDFHIDMRNRMNVLGTELAEALAAFQADLGSQSSKVVIIVMTEFGREVPNSRGGTDHGIGGMMMVMGDPLIGLGGGKVHLAEPWTGLAYDQLVDGRYLPVTTDYRSVCADVLQNHLGVTDMAAVFPGFAPEPVGLFATPSDVIAGDVNASGVVDSDDVRAILANAVGLTPQGSFSPGPGDINSDGSVNVADALALAQTLQRAGD